MHVAGKAISAPDLEAIADWPDLTLGAPSRPDLDLGGVSAGTVTNYEMALIRECPDRKKGNWLPLWNSVGHDQHPTNEAEGVAMMLKAQQDNDDE